MRAGPLNLERTEQHTKNTSLHLQWEAKKNIETDMRKPARGGRLVRSLFFYFGTVIISILCKIQGAEKRGCG